MRVRSISGIKENKKGGHVRAETPRGGVGGQEETHFMN